MRIDKCDGCNKLLDRKTDAFYSICEITKHIPDSHYSRMVITKHGESNEDINQITESWVNYLDIDLCEACWEKESIKRFVK